MIKTILMSVPIGTIMLWPSDNKDGITDNWMSLCESISGFDGNTNNELFDLLGTASLPDFQGRFLRCVDNISQPGAKYAKLLTTGGEYTHEITNKELPSHNHFYNPGGILILQKEDGCDSGSADREWRDDDRGRPNEPRKTSFMNGSNSLVRGNGEPHNNLHKYYVMEAYIRIK